MSAVTTATTPFPESQSSEFSPELAPAAGCGEDSRMPSRSSASAPTDLTERDCTPTCKGLDAVYQDAVRRATRPEQELELFMSGCERRHSHESVEPGVDDESSAEASSIDSSDVL